MNQHENDDDLTLSTGVSTIGTPESMTAPSSAATVHPRQHQQQQQQDQSGEYIPAIIFLIVMGGYVIRAIWAFFHGNSDWWAYLLQGFLAGSLAIIAVLVLASLCLCVIWCTWGGGACFLLQSAWGFIRNARAYCPPPRPTYEEIQESCILTGMTVFVNSIVWSMVIGLFFSSSNDNYDEGPPWGLVIFFVPFVLLSLGLVFVWVFKGPLYHFSFYPIYCFSQIFCSYSLISTTDGKDGAKRSEQQNGSLDRDDESETVITSTSSITMELAELHSGELTSEDSLRSIV